MKLPNAHKSHDHSDRTVKRENKEDILKRIRKIEGQVQGISRMIENDRYCPDILTQINAAKSALESTAMMLMEDHTRNCIVSDIRKGKANLQ